MRGTRGHGVRGGTRAREGTGGPGALAAGRRAQACGMNGLGG